MHREEEMWDLQERKENAVRKDVPPDFYGDSMDGPVKDQEEMIIAPRETEADKANDIK